MLDFHPLHWIKKTKKKDSRIRIPACAGMIGKGNLSILLDL